MNDRLNLNMDPRINQARHELLDIQTMMESGDIDSPKFRDQVSNFLTRHAGQAYVDVVLDDVVGGNKGTADNEYGQAVTRLDELYSGMARSPLSEGQQHELLTQAEQVVYADVDSYVERETGRDPGNFRPTADNSTEVAEEAKTEAPVEADPNIAAPRTGLSDTQAANLRYTQGPTAEQVAAGNEMGLGHRDGAVTDVQQHLIDKGFYGDAADGAFDQADGFFGPKTQSALTQWQTTQGLEATGTVNAEVLSRMGLGDDPAVAAGTRPSDLRIGDDDAATERPSTERTEATTKPASGDAQALRTAMSIRDDLAGPGTSDYSGMARQMLDMSPAQMAELRQVYPTIAGGESLADAITNDLAINQASFGANDRQALVAIVNGDRSGGRGSAADAIRDADTLRTAMHGRPNWNPLDGLGTDDETLMDVLANRSPAQMRQIAAEYENLTGNDFRSDVASETRPEGFVDGQYQEIMLQLLDQAGI